MTFASRVRSAIELLRGRCPHCKRLNQADPSMRVVTRCDCGQVLQPRRAVGGVEFTAKAVN